MFKRIIKYITLLKVLAMFNGCEKDEQSHHQENDTFLYETVDEENYNIDEKNIYESNNEIEDVDIISDEQKGLEIIVDELQKQGYNPEINDGSWKLILQNPDTGEYNIVLQPDIRIMGYKYSKYSYIEFNSKENPGVGFSNEFPPYIEIQPDIEQNIRKVIQEIFKQNN